MEDWKWLLLMLLLAMVVAGLVAWYLGEDDVEED